LATVLKGMYVGYVAPGAPPWVARSAMTDV